jgi:hypothetical protein
LQPATSLALLEEISNFLRARLSCFVTLHVRNPEFEKIRADFRVCLAAPDETYYKKQLQKDITRFLSPWAFSDGGSPSFGSKIYKSGLIKFVEKLRYVDFVTDFKLYHILSSDNDEPRLVDEAVEASRAVSILVSAKEHEHIIEAIKPTTATLPGSTCPEAA